MNSQATLGYYSQLVMPRSCVPYEVCMGNMATRHVDIGRLHKDTA